MIVKVKKVPVRYKGKTYGPGKEIEIDKKHYNENLFDLAEEVEEKPLSKWNKDEIKNKLDELGIEYDSSANKDVLLAALEDAIAE